MVKKIPITKIRDFHPQLGTKEECIQNHYKMVLKVANGYDYLKIHGIDIDDLISEGTIGLLKAYDRFDPDKKPVKFSTFAFPYIRGHILRYLEGSAQLIHIPYHSDLPPKSFISIHKSVYMGNGKSYEISDIIPGEEDSTRHEIEYFIDTLVPREQVTARMLMEGFTVKMIGKNLGFTGTTISRFKKNIAEHYLQRAL